ncbi:hypothetical protein ADIARSV_1278 [Arcticibacter svalbardensis MN12-7]|uniref:Uncharacterized protein n=1 Tax=Arcticibacter svalbardensis MN12-7 TaxID=1150600 RepID=R9GUL0_9SPHI|nr:hypothetical protein ADIARSV_1278 [Arcticibacter svalbardensis MN12-7]
MAIISNLHVRHSIMGAINITMVIPAVAAIPPVIARFIFIVSMICF